ncbi:hypothetical protein ABZW11_03495 [Nonomuraea sp. NPDC004580]|uniref:hypothetical protein n=1 Tax=Nonomuraea sp. NPDC004580 TaxID=3154552 RepID=UPI0033A9062B
MLDRSGLGWGDAHVAMLADTTDCLVLTLDGSHWAAAAHALDEPLHVIEISEPRA